MGSVRSVFDGMAQHSKGVAIVGGVTIVVLIGTAFLLGKREQGAAEARNALYLAQKKHDAEMRALQPPPPPPAPDAKKGPKTGKDAKAATPPAEPHDDIEFKSLDVDAKLPETVKAYRLVIDKFSGSRAAYDAQMALGHLYLQHGQAAPSEKFLSQAVASAPRGVEKALALSALGYAREAQGKLKEAADSFNQAAATGEDAVQGDVLLALARCYEGMNDPTNARATYDKVISKLPNTEHARNAELFKAQLQ
jgi:TolA-binding protein